MKQTNMLSSKLLPYQFKKYALGFVLVGVSFLYLYFKDIRPSFLEISTFAISSTYLENRFFTIVKTNLLDELGFLFCVAGLFLGILSQEKNEEKHFEQLRFYSFFFAIKWTFAFWVFSYMFLYGYAIFIVSNFLFVVFLLTYYFRFRFLIREK